MRSAHSAGKFSINASSGALQLDHEVFLLQAYRIAEGKESKKYLSVWPSSIIICPFSSLSTLGIFTRSGFSQSMSTALVLPSPNPNGHLSVSCTPAVLFHAYDLVALQC